MVKILKCYLIPKKRYGTLFKGAIFFGQPCIFLMLMAQINVCSESYKLRHPIVIFMYLYSGCF